jgi:hypothetical protein
MTGGALKSAQLGASALLITLMRPAVAISATIARPALTELASRERRVKGHTIKSLRVTLIVTSASGSRTTLVLTDTKPR